MYECLVQGCPFRAKTRQGRRQHLMAVHSFPADFRFSVVVGKHKWPRQRHEIQGNAAKMDMAEDDDGDRHPAPASSDVAAVHGFLHTESDDHEDDAEDAEDMAAHGHDRATAEGSISRLDATGLTTAQPHIPAHFAFGRGRVAFTGQRGGSSGRSGGGGGGGRRNRGGGRHGAAQHRQQEQDPVCVWN